jgi:hypothetical protein
MYIRHLISITIVTLILRAQPRVPPAACAPGIEAWLREGFLASPPALSGIEECPMVRTWGQLNDYWALFWAMVLE